MEDELQRKHHEKKKLKKDFKTFSTKHLHKPKDQRCLNDGEKQSKNIIHNFSSYSSTKEEVEALSYGLDQHTPN